MKARIEKKLSNKIATTLPEMYQHSWVDDDISELSWEQGSRVSHILRVGGGVDYWGEGEDDYSILSDFINHFDWCYPIYNPYPDGHEWQGMPIPTKKRITGMYLIQCAKKISKANL